MNKLLRLCVVICLLGLASQQAIAKPKLLFRMHGSNTIGALLGPEMVVAWFASRHYQQTQKINTKKDEQFIVAKDQNGNDVAVEIQAHGSSTGFHDLIAKHCDIAMASRPIKDDEAEKFNSYGKIRSKSNEIVVGMDGIAVIVNPSNPLRKLSREKVQRIFDGNIRNWREVGYKNMPIHVYARDHNSGTFDTFRSLVLGKHHKLLPLKKRFESNPLLSEAVFNDANGIGFVGLPYVLKNKALAIRDGEVSIKPNLLSVATEDYAISRRLFLYKSPNLGNDDALAFIDFAASQAGQNVVAKVGFISQNINLYAQKPANKAPKEYSNFVQHAKRMSLNIRFDRGSSLLDRKAQRDMDRILRFMAQPENKNAKLMLFGFADSNETVPLYSIGLSNQRVDSVADALVKKGINVIRSRGYGSALAVADNDTKHGRFKNRRVEVWVGK